MDQVTSSYQMVINNVAGFIGSPQNRAAIENGEGLSAFTASLVIGIAFCKAKEEVVCDLIKVQ